MSVSSLDREGRGNERGQYMTEYTCYDCTGRADELVTFVVSVGGEEYGYDPRACPMCGQSSTVETVDEWKERHDE